MTLVVLCQTGGDDLQHHHNHAVDWNLGWVDADVVFLHGHFQQTDDNGLMVGANGLVFFEVWPHLELVFANVCSYLGLVLVYVFSEQDFLLLHVGSNPWTWDKCLQKFQYCSSFSAYYESLLYVPVNKMSIPGGA